jgi:hypothetical protein
MEYPRVIFKLYLKDRVRLMDTSGPYYKEFRPHWSREIFWIRERIASRPPKFKLADEVGTPVKGVYYAGENGVIF